MEAKEITAKDLRIGNLILDTECEPHYFEVEQISKHVGSELWIRYRKDSIKAKRVEGIPLTEEWLKRLSFKRYSKDFFKIDFEHERIWYVPDTKRVRIGHDNSFYNAYQFPIEYNYVHELQNLVYSISKQELTLSELTIKEK